MLTCNQKPTCSQFSIYCTNQTKRVNGKKTKKKTIEQSRVCKGSPNEGLGGQDFRKRYLLGLEWKTVKVMDSLTR